VSREQQRRTPAKLAARRSDVLGHSMIVKPHPAHSFPLEWAGDGNDVGEALE